MPIICCPFPRRLRVKSAVIEDKQHATRARFSPQPTLGSLIYTRGNPIVTEAAQPSERVQERPTLQEAAGPTTVIPVEPSELAELVVEDSDTDDERQPNARRKSTGPLELVKTRICRHLSQGSPSRDKNRYSAPLSEEEIERRAELKRLRDRRIQEELRGEEQGLSNGSISPKHHQQANGILPGNISARGPRDDIEFSVTRKSSRTNTVNLAPSVRSGPCSPSKEKSGTDCCTKRNGDGIQRDSLDNCQPSHRFLQQPLTSIPPSPDLQPALSPSSSLASWRLSYNAERLEEYIRGPQGSPVAENVPGTVSTATPPVHGPHRAGADTPPQISCVPDDLHPNFSPDVKRSRTGDSSPMKLWLRSQGLDLSVPSTAVTYTDPDLDQDTDLQQAQVVYLKRPNSTPHPAVVPETDTRRYGVIHLQDMEIHEWLATNSLNTPQYSPSPSQSMRENQRHNVAGQQDSGADSTEPPTDQSGLQAQEQVEERAASSFYPSGAASTHLIQSPNTSAMNIPSPQAYQEFSSFDFKEFNLSLNSYGLDESQQQTNYATLAPKSETQKPASPSGPDGRLPDQRINTVERSISYRHLDDGTPDLVVHDFPRSADSPAPPRVSRKPSLLAKLHLTIPRRRTKNVTHIYDGSGPTEQSGMSATSLPIFRPLLTATHAAPSVLLDTTAVSSYCAQVHHSKRMIYRHSSVPNSFSHRQEATQLRSIADTLTAIPGQEQNGGGLVRKPLTEKFPGVVKLGLGKLVSTKAMSLKTIPKIAEQDAKSDDKDINIVVPAMILEPKFPNGNQLTSSNMIQSVDVNEATLPLILQNMEGRDSRVSLTARMAALLSTDGSSPDQLQEVQSSSSSAGTLVLATAERVQSEMNITSPARAHREESSATTTTTATNNFVTPMSSMRHSNNDSSYHSYPDRSTPTPREEQAVAGEGQPEGDVRSGTGKDVDEEGRETESEMNSPSIRSDTAIDMVKAGVRRRAQGLEAPISFSVPDALGMEVVH